MQLLPGPNVPEEMWEMLRRIQQDVEQCCGVLPDTCPSCSKLRDDCAGHAILGIAVGRNLR